MGRAKIAITIDRSTLKRLDEMVEAKLYPNRSQAVQAAISEKLDQLERGRLARECAKLDPKFEKALAEEGIAAELSKWPEY